MPLLERPPLETLAPAKDRWTPLYLEHGRLEVDDSSVKWIRVPSSLGICFAATGALGVARTRLGESSSTAEPGDAHGDRLKAGLQTKSKPARPWA
jgi:hypothetical protein